MSNRATCIGTLRGCVKYWQETSKHVDELFPAFSDDDLTIDTLIGLIYFNSYCKRASNEKRNAAFCRTKCRYLHASDPAVKRLRDDELRKSLSGWESESYRNVAIFLASMMGYPNPAHKDGRQDGMILWSNAQIDCDMDNNIMGYRELGVMDKPGKGILLKVDNFFPNKARMKSLLGVYMEIGTDHYGTFKKDCPLFPTVTVTKRYIICRSDSIPQGIFAIYAIVTYLQNTSTIDDCTKRFNEDMAYVKCFNKTKENLRECYKIGDKTNAETGNAEKAFPLYQYARYFKQHINYRQHRIYSTLVDAVDLILSNSLEASKKDALAIDVESDKKEARSDTNAKG